MDIGFEKNELEHILGYFSHSHLVTLLQCGTFRPEVTPISAEVEKNLQRIGQINFIESTKKSSSNRPKNLQRIGQINFIESTKKSSSNRPKNLQRIVQKIFIESAKKSSANCPNLQNLDSCCWIQIAAERHDQMFAHV
jgi:hypothetical protein